MEKQDEMIKFAADIEDLVEYKDISYVDAIILYSENKGLEIEVVAKLCSDSIKSKIQTEYENLHYLPKSNTTKLPF